MTKRTRGTVIFGTMALAGVCGALERQFPEYLNPGGWPVLKILAGVTSVWAVMSRRPKRAMYLGMLSMGVGAPQSYKFGQSLIG